MSENKSEWTKQRWISWAEEVGLGLTLAQKRMTKFALIQEIEAMHRASEGSGPEASEAPALSDALVDPTQISTPVEPALSMTRVEPTPSATPARPKARPVDLTSSNATSTEDPRRNKRYKR